jgi:hypothetical protein
MELRRNLLLIIGMLLGACGFAAAQETLSISDGNSVGLSPEILSITMDASFAVQGFVLAIGYDESLVTATDLATAGSAEDAELIIPEVLTGGVTMGVIMDAEPPFDGQTIAPGGAILIAELTMTPLVVVASETLASIDFVDGVLNTPPSQQRHRPEWTLDRSRGRSGTQRRDTDHRGATSCHHEGGRFIGICRWAGDHG